MSVSVPVYLSASVFLFVGRSVCLRLSICLHPSICIYLCGLSVSVDLRLSICLRACRILCHISYGPMVLGYVLFLGLRLTIS